MVQKTNNGSVGEERIRRRAETRRLEILRAAARVFRERGFAATGMRDIAAEADLSSGNLYHYFDGKQEILYFCQDRALETMLSALERARLGRGSAAERLHAVIRAHLHCLLDEVEGSVAHLEVDSLPAELREDIVSKRDRYEQGIRTLIAGGVAEDEFAPCDPGLVTRAILGAINWTVRWFRPEGPQPAGTVADALAEYLVRGLLPTKHEQAAELADSGGQP